MRHVSLSLSLSLRDVSYKITQHKERTKERERVKTDVVVYPRPECFVFFSSCSLARALK
jgi:hypothetical protein